MAQPQRKKNADSGVSHRRQKYKPVPWFRERSTLDLTAKVFWSGLQFPELTFAVFIPFGKFDLNHLANLNGFFLGETETLPHIRIELQRKIFTLTADFFAMKFILFTAPICIIRRCQCIYCCSEACKICNQRKQNSVPQSTHKNHLPSRTILKVSRLPADPEAIKM